MKIYIKTIDGIKYPLDISPNNTVVYLHLFASKIRKVTGLIHSFLPPSGEY